MIFTILIEYGLVVLCALFLITQLIIPVFRNSPLFPLFRKTNKEKEVVEELIREQCVKCETELSKIELEKLKKLEEEIKAKKEKI